VVIIIIRHLVKYIIIFVFLKSACIQEYIFCIKIFEPGKLTESVFRNWRYLYYGYNPYMKHYSEEILNFYIETMQKGETQISTRITNYNFVEQKSFLRNKFWGHYSIVFENIHQPIQEVSFNLMLTTNNSTIINDINPNFLKLSNKTILLDNKFQYITNYAIFLNENDVIELSHICEKNKFLIENYLISNNNNILENFNKILQNYKKINN